MTLDVLAIGAHPDDVEIGCSGTLIDLSDRGYKIGVADLTDANLSTRGDQISRREEAENATTVMNISKRYRLGFEESTINSAPDNLTELVGLIREVKPHVLIAPYWKDRHPDHIDASKLTHAAVFWAGVSRYGNDKPPHRPHRVLYYFLHTEGPVSFVVDITSSFDRKLKAVRSYKSQFLPQPGDTQLTYISRPEFLENLISRARYYGSKIGVEYGEPFYTREMNKVEDVVSWANDQGVVG